LVLWATRALIDSQKLFMIQHDMKVTRNTGLSPGAGDHLKDLDLFES
jgi:hypothetical protein